MTSRRLALLLVALAAVLLAARLSFLQGWLNVVRIDGGSMAEALPGAHVELTCSQCSRVWRIDQPQRAANTGIICPECGAAADEETLALEQTGTRVIIDRAAYWLDRPQRFDVVAFRTAESVDELAVKRIVALPGEAWEIRRGEVLIGGQLLRKNYALFRELATIVSSSARRWHGTSETRWQASESSWSWRGSAETPDWLEYRHVAAHPAARERPAAVQDLDAYNPALARELNEVVDVVAQCDVSAHDVVLEFRVYDGHDPLLVRWDLAAGLVVALRHEQEVARCRVPAGTSRTCQLAWGVCDRQLLLVLNDQVLLRHELEDTAQAIEPALAPLAIGVSGEGECRLQNLRVLRDIYYLDSQGRGGPWTASSPDSDQYGVLGDNPPLSIDSRQWDDGIRRGQILGKVFAR